MPCHGRIARALKNREPNRFSQTITRHVSFIRERRVEKNYDNTRIINNRKRTPSQRPRPLHARSSRSRVVRLGLRGGRFERYVTGDGGKSHSETRDTRGHGDGKRLCNSRVNNKSRRRAQAASVRRAAWETSRHTWLTLRTALSRRFPTRSVSRPSGPIISRRHRKRLRTTTATATTARKRNGTLQSPTATTCTRRRRSRVTCPRAGRPGPGRGPRVRVVRAMLL